jgi:hypothetical protein
VLPIGREAAPPHANEADVVVTKCARSCHAYRRGALAQSRARSQPALSSLVPGATVGVLSASPRKDGIPNPKRRFVFDWNEKRWRLAASRDVRILGKYHPEIKVWVTYTLGNALECRSMLAIIGAVAGAPALKDWPVMVDA